MTCDSIFFTNSIRTTVIHWIHWLLDTNIEPLVAFIIFVSKNATKKRQLETLVFTIEKIIEKFDICWELLAISGIKFLSRED